jgi:hypothetical protein
MAELDAELPKNHLSVLYRQRDIINTSPAYTLLFYEYN